MTHEDFLTDETRIAVVIPAYKVKHHIASVVSGIPDFVERIYVVDDACPDRSGLLVQETVGDDRVTVIFLTANQGVGGAVLAGYQAAIKDGMEIIVKVDGDGQMDAGLIPDFVTPIISGDADYTKGNRFFDLDNIGSMPPVRIFGNAVLSFLTKFSSGYWNLFDPTNGFTAIHADVARHLPFQKISNRYFFETDMLFRLNILRAVVVDVPMDARYGDEVSNLKVHKIFFEFLFCNVRNFYKRIFYNYYLRDISVASVELPFGVLFLLFGTAWGARSWIISAGTGLETSAGNVMLAAMPLLVGVQLILAFIGYDIASVPKRPRHRFPSLKLTRLEKQ